MFTKHPDTALAYSDWTQINEDGSPSDSRFDEAAGWRYSDVEIEGTTYLRCHALAAVSSQSRLHLVRAEPRARFPASAPMSRSEATTARSRFSTTRI